VTNEQGLVTGDMLLLPIQRWFFAQQQPQMHHWNQAMLLSTQRRLDPDLLKSTLEHILLHHDALRSRFLWQNHQWQQTIAGMGNDIPLEVFDLSALEETEFRAALETCATEVQATLNLEEGPLVRMVYFSVGNDIPGRLLIVIHHLAVDGVSWRILLEDIATAYEQLSNGQAVSLPAKTLSIQQWSRRLHEYAQSMELRQELPYWLAQARRRSLALPVDYEGGENTVASSASLIVSLNAEETRALLQDVPQAYHTQINDALLTALTLAMAHWRGQSPLLVHLEGHGREEILEGVDISRTVGWFTSLYPVLLELDEQDQPGQALKSIKEQLRAIPQRGIGYGLLRYLCEDTQVAEQVSQLPAAELSFNYLGQFDQTLSQTALFGPAPESPGLSISLLGYRQHLLDIIGSVIGGQLHLTWTYSQNLHCEETISRLAQHYLRALREIIAHCRPGETVGYTPSDFPEADLNQKDLDKIINRLKKRKGR
ncbi:MAG TPA: condensation domain-containing protein, partial [Ktedonobacteraceae bacterium]|nr:condensation domain-containing protein [Ktedonobacteraceae bacterium]